MQFQPINPSIHRLIIVAVLQSLRRSAALAATPHCLHVHPDTPLLQQLVFSEVLITVEVVQQLLPSCAGPQQDAG